MPRSRRYFNASLQNITRLLRSFKAQIPTTIKEIVLANEAEIVNTISEKQLYELGITGRGQRIDEYQPYRPRTIAYKIRRGQPIDRVTLKDTGEFYKGMHIVFEDDGFYITSDSRPTPFLIARYGEEIFRLTDENFYELLRTTIRDGLINKLRLMIS